MMLSNIEGMSRTAGTPVRRPRGSEITKASEARGISKNQGVQEREINEEPAHAGGAEGDWK